MTEFDDSLRLLREIRDGLEAMRNAPAARIHMKQRELSVTNYHGNGMNILRKHLIKRIEDFLCDRI